MPAPKKKSVNPVNAAKGRVAVAKGNLDKIKAIKKIAKDEATKQKNVQSKLLSKKTAETESGLSDKDVAKFNTAGGKIMRSETMGKKASKVTPKYMQKYSDAVRTSGRARLVKKK